MACAEPLLGPEHQDGGEAEQGACQQAEAVQQVRGQGAGCRARGDGEADGGCGGLVGVQGLGRRRGEARDEG